MNFSKCKRCNRSLSNPSSMEAGMGPTCRVKIVQIENTDSRLPLLPFDGDVVCRRTPQGPQFNIPHAHIKHSPTGMEWGYAGSGPADFALNILCQFIPREQAEESGLYQDFKWEFVTKLPEAGGTIKKETILKWIEEKRSAPEQLEAVNQ